MELTTSHYSHEEARTTYPWEKILPWAGCAHVIFYFFLEGTSSIRQMQIAMT